MVLQTIQPHKTIYPKKEVIINNADESEATTTINTKRQGIANNADGSEATY